MSKNFTKILVIMMVMFLAFPNFETSAFASSESITVTETSTRAKLVRGTISASNISKYGNVYLSIKCAEFYEAGYEYGDIVKVKFLGKKYRLPFVTNYADVNTGSPAILAREGEIYVSLAINMGDFASTYGIATKTKHEDGTVEWSLAENRTEPIKISIWLKEAGGYSDQFELHRLAYTNERSDYPDLSDEEFANFREVTTTGMGIGILYRTSSPVNPANKRNLYADNALREAGVSVVINLADTEDGIKEFEGFSESYYSTLSYITLDMDIDFLSDDFQQKLAKGLRFMIENPGVYAVHCKEGKDRAGYVTAILECLMGASYEEVINDYMTSFYNYYGITESDPRYDIIIKNNISATLKKTFTFKNKDKKKDLSTRDLSKCAVKFLKKIGLTSQEIVQLKKNLSGKQS